MKFTWEYNDDLTIRWNNQLLVKRKKYLGYLVWFPSQHILDRASSLSRPNYCRRCHRVSPVLWKASKLKATDIHPSVTEQSQLVPFHNHPTLKTTPSRNSTLQGGDAKEGTSTTIYVSEIALRVLIPYRDGALVLNEESGLSDATRMFLEKPQRLHAFVSALRGTLGDRFTAGTFFLGGDGRYYAKEALLRILYTCLGFGNVALIVAKDGLASVPAASLAIHYYSCEGGILCSVNRKAAGEEQFFGIQYVLGNGGPMRDIFLSRFRNQLDKVTEYRVVGIDPQVDISTLGEYFVDENRHYVKVIDPLELYVERCKQWFPMARIRRFLQQHSQFLLIDTLHSIMGRYAYRIFVEELGLHSSQILHHEYKEDYAGLHPNPYHEDNYQRMKERLRKKGTSKNSNRLGVVLDNEGRYASLVTSEGMILSTQDSLAVFLTCIGQVIPRFAKVFRGVGKTFVHSKAIDRVTDVLDMSLYEGPCGWRYMTNLMDREKVDICMDENGGLGCSWIRERDGLLLVLCWLSLLSWKNENRSYEMDIHEIMEQHWSQYGRDYHMCYFYRAKNKSQKQRMETKMQMLWNQIGRGLSWKEMHPHLDHHKYKSWLNNLRIEEYQCYNPFEGMTHSQLGVCLYIKDTHRIILRLSVVPTGKDSSENEPIDVENVIGLAIYLETFETHHISINEYNPEEICKPL
ncbi:phosphoglucomutase [Galdieria sulphuraria]|uniref:Phosphoglucomutase n=1 Tax=Galdieria sulphuraria TaxID=130081 RepID=M2XVY2_GALSU|nr:phosphoglucomutase [Galdieria sulphuraria]EME27803.1 phosphoglucomutase [Galdieria sulphuraria]|eukprot:XP_005704323.1 phosphoglucomutase [Galdieria sulphuraria]